MYILQNKVRAQYRARMPFPQSSPCCLGMYSNITPPVPAEGRGGRSERLGSPGVSGAAGAAGGAELAVSPPVSVAVRGRQPWLLWDVLVLVTAWPGLPALAGAGTDAVTADRRLASGRQGCRG